MSKRSLSQSSERSALVPSARSATCARAASVRQAGPQLCRACKAVLCATQGCQHSLRRQAGRPPGPAAASCPRSSSAPSGCPPPRSVALPPARPGTRGQPGWSGTPAAAQERGAHRGSPHRRGLPPRCLPGGLGAGRGRLGAPVALHARTAAGARARAQRRLPTCLHRVQLHIF